MDFGSLIPIFGILLVMIPVLGVTTVLTLRLGLKPFMESLSGSLPKRHYASSPERDLRIADLAEQVEVLTAEVRRLKEAQEFDHRLLESQAKSPSGED